MWNIFGGSFVSYNKKFVKENGKSSGLKAQKQFFSTHRYYSVHMYVHVSVKHFDLIVFVAALNENGENYSKLFLIITVRRCFRFS